MRAAVGFGFVANMSDNNYTWFRDKGCCEQSILLIGNCKKWLLNVA